MRGATSPGTREDGNNGGGLGTRAIIIALVAWEMISVSDPRSLQGLAAYDFRLAGLVTPSLPIARQLLFFFWLSHSGGHWACIPLSCCYSSLFPPLLFFPSPPSSSSFFFLLSHTSSPLLSSPLSSSLWHIDSLATFFPSILQSLLVVCTSHIVWVDRIFRIQAR